MPHTSRKKKKAPPTKREQVDEDGWTRITSPKRNIRNSTAVSEATPYDPHNVVPTPNESARSILPPDIKLDDVIKRYETLEKRWLESESWKVLKGKIEEYVEEDATNAITTCVVLGTGTMCGLKDNWIMRHDVAIFQSAVFISVVDAIGKSTR